MSVASEYRGLLIAVARAYGVAPHEIADYGLGFFMRMAHHIFGKTQSNLSPEQGEKFVEDLLKRIGDM